MDIAGESSVLCDGGTSGWFGVLVEDGQVVRLRGGSMDGVKCLIESTLIEVLG